MGHRLYGVCGKDSVDHLDTQRSIGALVELYSSTKDYEQAVGLLAEAGTGRFRPANSAPRLLRSFLRFLLRAPNGGSLPAPLLSLAPLPSSVCCLAFCS